MANADPRIKSYLTPPEVAAQLRVTPEKVIGWILAGELAGTNVAAKRNGIRPRYRIAAEDLADFLRRRSGAVEPRATRTPPRRAVEYRRYV